MNSNQYKHAIGILSTREIVEPAMQELKAAGLDMSRVSVLAKDSNRPQPMSYEDLKKSLSRADIVKLNATEGAAKGGLLALAGGIAALLIPGIGLPLVAESVLTVLLGSATVAVSGGLVGALRGWFVPENEAAHYSDRVDQGDYLVAIEGTETEIHQAEQILNKWNIQEWNVFATPKSLKP